MSLAPGQVQILRCEIERVRRMAASSDSVQLVAPPTSSLTLDSAFLHAAFEAGAYVQTLSELVVLRGLGKYVQFDAVYDRLNQFLDDPTIAALDHWGLAFAGLFGAAAAHRGIPDPCGYRIIFPGLDPPDPAIVPETAPDKAEIDVTEPPTAEPQSPPFYKNPTVIGLGLGAAALGLVLGLIVSARRVSKPEGPLLPPPAF
jgi:hypothetical protein